MFTPTYDGMLAASPTAVYGLPPPLAVLNLWTGFSSMRKAEAETTRGKMAVIENTNLRHMEWDPNDRYRKNPRLEYD